MHNLDALVGALENAIWQNVVHNDKNTDVITLSERLVRVLRGGRITSCKSGKDRTSMAVTAEQARLLHEAHGVAEAEAAMLMDEMRAHGVRWLNMRKNVGMSKGEELRLQLAAAAALARGLPSAQGTFRHFGGPPT